MLYSNGCEYAIRALTHLAPRPPDELVQLRQIAAAEDVPAPFVGKVLQDLVRAGLLRSVKGPRGGYALARPPADISLLDIKAATDGTSELERCAVGLGRCSDDMPCPQHDTFKPLRRAIRSYLETTTLEDMAGALAAKRAMLAGDAEEETTVGAGSRKGTVSGRTGTGVTP